MEPPAIIYSYLYASMEIIHTISQFYFSHSAIYPTHIPIYPATLALFIAYIFNRDYAPSTVNTYVSALSYSHKLSGLPDPTQVFYIAQMLKAAIWERGFRLDSRLPITLPILHSLLEDSSQITGSEYQICQFKAMCSLAYHPLHY